MNSIELRKKFPNAPESFIRANATDAFGILPQQANGKRIRQSEKPLMNKLEQAWFSQLSMFSFEGERVNGLRAQAIKFKIGGNAFYKPDMTGWRGGRLTAWECKGIAVKNIDRGKLALKVAAHQWPEVDFWLVWKQDGQWQQQRILP